MTQGHVRGLSQYYADGLERMEIWINKRLASPLPYVNNLRIPIKLYIGTQCYEGGIRTTPNVDYVWICPDLRDDQNRKISLARVLANTGFNKNQIVFLNKEGDRIKIAGKGTEN